MMKFLQLKRLVFCNEEDDQDGDDDQNDEQKSAFACSAIVAEKQWNSVPTIEG